MLVGVGFLINECCDGWIVFGVYIKGKLYGKREVTGRRGRRRKQLLDDLKEKTGCCRLKGEALARTVWRTGLGRGCGPVVRQAEYTGCFTTLGHNCSR